MFHHLGKGGFGIGLEPDLGGTADPDGGVLLHRLVPADIPLTGHQTPDFQKERSLRGEPVGEMGGIARPHHQKKISLLPDFSEDRTRLGHRAGKLHRHFPFRQPGGKHRRSGTFNRVFPGRINGQHHDRIGPGQRLDETSQERG